MNKPVAYMKPYYNGYFLLMLDCLVSGDDHRENDNKPHIITPNIFMEWLARWKFLL